MIIQKNGVIFDFAKGVVASIQYQGIEILAKPSNLFAIRLTDKAGATVDYTSQDAKKVEKNEDVVTYSDFPENISVQVKMAETDAGITLRFAVKNGTDKIGTFFYSSQKGRMHTFKLYRINQYVIIFHRHNEYN